MKSLMLVKGSGIAVGPRLRGGPMHRHDNSGFIEFSASRVETAQRFLEIQ
jgi:hypothetical protein